jgi:DNA helicase-2/ATP-dependent DNA helicase PcrA
VPSQPPGEALLEGLTASQRDAVLSEGAPLCILAAAGAGKTRVLTTRIAYRATAGLADARHVLALTFTRKAAGELQHRLRSLGMREPAASGTFHSVATAQLQRWWADRRRQAPSVLERKSRILGPLVSSRPALTIAALGDLAGLIEWAKARLIGPEGFAEAVASAGRRLPQGVSAGDVASLYARYEHEKRRRGLVDFDDLLSSCAEAIERDPEFAAAQRWRWRHLFVDEFQDLNPLQHRLLMAWLGTSTDLCVVGDPHQAIYGWNGSDPRLLDSFPDRWPTASVVRLDANHRCTEEIVAAAASVLDGGGSHLRSSGRTGPVPEVRMWPSELAEARAIASAVHRAHAAGRPWSSMAVLTRTNAQIAPIQDALSSAGVPVRAPSRAAVLEDPVARQAIASFRGRPHLPVRAVIADLEEMCSKPLPEDESAINRGVAPGRLEDETRGVLAYLAGLAKAFAAEEPGGTAGRWTSWLPSATRDRTETPSGADAVSLCSFHRAKGLEWDAVWIAGVEQGLVPIGRATGALAEAEERRLLYVALTRASTEVHCSWARERTFGTYAVRRDPSPWLAAIEAANPDNPDSPDGAVPLRSRRGSDGSTWRRRFADQRATLRETSGPRRAVRAFRVPEGYPDPDPELTGQIKAWRLEAARSSGVPAYAILHDATVEALAAMRPTTSEELMAVPGLGPVKAGRYGPSLLALLAAGGKVSR